MRRLLGFLLVAGPLLMIIGGVYILALTPDVVTQTVKYEHSHDWGMVLTLFGAVITIVAGLIAVEADLL